MFHTEQDEQDKAGGAKADFYNEQMMLMLGRSKPKEAVAILNGIYEDMKSAGKKNTDRVVDPLLRLAYINFFTPPESMPKHILDQIVAESR